MFVTELFLNSDSIWITFLKCSRSNRLPPAWHCFISNLLITASYVYVIIMEIKIRVTRDERCLLHAISTIQFPAKNYLSIIETLQKDMKH